MEDIDSFSIHDAYFGVGVKSGNYDMFKPGKDGDWESYRAVRAVLKENGYVFHDDPRLHHKILKRSHHAGSKGDVHFHSEIYPAGFRFEFYRDVVADNPHGNRYDFRKMETAPYLWRLRVTLIHRKMAAALLARGFKDRTDPVSETAIEAVMKRRAKSMEWHAEHFKRPPESYNGTDADGVLLLGGETRYFRMRNGHLTRGVVWRGLNNCWDLVQNRTEWTNEATFRLFTYDPEKHPRKISFDPIERMTRALQRAIETRNFFRAGRIQEALRRIVPDQDFKPGDKVFVDHHNYHGYGIVEYVRPPLYVGVKVGRDGSGNTWRYEWGTVKPVPAEVMA
jgi:hypothetical protein